MNLTVISCVFMVCATFVITNCTKAVREGDNIKMQLDFARGASMGGVGDRINRSPKI